MSNIQYPQHHVNEVWNIPDTYFHHSLGLLIGGGQAAKRLNCCRQLLYRDADNLNLTVVRRNRVHGGRYFLVTEIDHLIRQRQKVARSFGRKSVQRIARRH